MPVLTNLNDIPERILYRFLKANFYPAGEIPLIMPVYRRFGFVSLPDEGFFITDKRVIVYETRIIVGLAKHSEFLFEDIAGIAYTKHGSSVSEFTFTLNDGIRYMIKINLSSEECELIKNKLLELIQS